jgi:phosphatidylglycerol:prolipoprotein diacylglycerol transferase
MTFALVFPQIDPVAVAVGPFAIRWYALAYVVGILLGWAWAVRLGKTPPLVAKLALDDFVMWATLGIVLGGRLGYVLFYKPLYFLQNPIEILIVWQGGMAFHGGFLGVMTAVLLFARRRGIPLFVIGDLVACAAPIGLFFGRIANFVNGELWGRVSDVPWAMVFPGAGPDPRHPSQLYQAGLEGLALFVVMSLVVWAGGRRRPGLLIGIFLIGYGVARVVGEFFRQPDAHLGFLFAGATMGQLLSLPMLLVGMWFVRRALLRPALTA